MEQQEELGNNEVEEILPHDLTAHHILTRVPIKSLLQFKCVSKQWYSSLSSSHFSHLYSVFSPFSKPSSFIQFLIIQSGKSYYLYSHDHDDDNEIVADETYCNNSKNLFELRIDFGVAMPEKLNLIGSCNGLVCLASYSDIYFILWNPITGKFRKYSDFDLSIHFPTSSSSTSTIPYLRAFWGFGYVSDVDDFKVVRILEFPATLEIMVHVFSLKTNKWTRMADELYQEVFSLKSGTCRKEGYYVGPTEPLRWLPSAIHTERGVLVNEMLYWIVTTTHGEGRRFIVAFDLVCEEFSTVVNLSLVSNFFYEDKFLCNMGGCLSKCGIFFRRNSVHINMLKCPMKVEDIVLSCDLHLEPCHDFVGFTRTGMFFIVHKKSRLGLINPSTAPVKYTPLITLERPLESQIANFVPSLTLPFTIGELLDGTQ